MDNNITNWYLDCYYAPNYYYDISRGIEYPEISYGPATLPEIMWLETKLSKHFHRVEITENTRGLNIRGRSMWPISE